jgi:hypothetical protein
MIDTISCWIRLKIKSAEHNTLLNRKQGLEAIVKRMDETCVDCEKGIGCEDDLQFLSLKSTIKRQLEETDHIQPQVQQQPESEESEELEEEDDWIECDVDGSDDLENRIAQFGKISGGSVCVIEGLKKELVGEALELKVVIKDKQMRTKNEGGNRIEVEGLNVVVEDKNNGTYNVVGQFEEEGQHLVKVWINGRLKASFSVEYRNKQPSKCWFISRDPQVKICFGSKGTAQGQFNLKHNWIRCCGVAVDGQGNIIVADSLNDRIQVFDGSGNFLRMWGSEGTGPAQFHCPSGVAVDGQGHFVVADSWNHRIQVFG